MIEAVFDEYLVRSYSPHSNCYWYIIRDKKCEYDQRPYRIDCKIMIRIDCRGLNYFSWDGKERISITHGDDYLIVDYPEKEPTLTTKARKVVNITEEMKKDLLKIIYSNISRFTEEEKELLLDELLKD